MDETRQWIESGGRFGLVMGAARLRRNYKLADVSEESRDGWRKFASSVGCTPTALAEIIGRHLADQTVEDNTFGPFGREVVAEAQELTRARRRRDGNGTAA